MKERMLTWRELVPKRGEPNRSDLDISVGGTKGMTFSRGTNRAAINCSIKFGLKWSEVSTCTTGQESQALVEKYWDEAESLKPPIIFVPQIAVNKYRGNMHFQDYVEEHLEEVVCSTLAKEKVTPAACVNKTISYPDLLNQMN